MNRFLLATITLIFTCSSVAEPMLYGKVTKVLADELIAYFDAGADVRVGGAIHYRLSKNLGERISSISLSNGVYRVRIQTERCSPAEEEFNVTYSYNVKSSEGMYHVSEVTPGDSYCIMEISYNTYEPLSSQ